jgi:hypothetical protein
MKLRSSSSLSLKQLSTHSQSSFPHTLSHHLSPDLIISILGPFVFREGPAHQIPQPLCPCIGRGVSCAHTKTGH